MISAINQASLTIVISRGQSRNPKKRALEQCIADEAAKIDGADVVVVPHLYDLPKSSDSFQQLSEVEGDLVVFSWIYSRAAHWVLDRNGIQGQYVASELVADDDEDDQDFSLDPELSADEEDVVDRVADLYPRPDRSIHCIDLKISDSQNVFVDELLRLVNRCFEGESPASLPIVGGKLVEVQEQTSRRWYPVIDFNRCTNCMECIDFCLFGVYGVDGAESILVEQPDNCRKGCPACSRVCPENAIIFPQHKAPAIAGAEVEGEEGFKIDLSQLFGAPADNADPIATAARERDEQLLLAGRDAVGIDDKLRKRQEKHEATPKDRLDYLIDSLDEFDL